MEKVEIMKFKKENTYYGYTKEEQFQRWQKEHNITKKHIISITYLPDEIVVFFVKDLEDLEASHQADIDDLNAEIEKLKDVLEWYAHPDTYNYAGNNVLVVMMDKGWNARNVLGKLLEGEPHESTKDH